MIPKVGVDMTVDEAKICVELLVYRLGYRRVLRVVLRAAHTEAGQRATDAEREFAELQRIAEAAGLEQKGEADDD